MTRPDPRRRRRFRLAALLLAVALAVAVVAVFEARQRRRELGGLIRPLPGDVELRWVPVPGRHDLNRHGFRGPDWPEQPTPGTPRVAVVGDSVTHGGPVAADRAYPARTRELLARAGVRAELLNLGVLGYDLVQIRRLVDDRVWALQPDVLVYGYFTNDHQPASLIQVGEPPFTVPAGVDGLSPRLVPTGLGGGALRRHSALYRTLEGRWLLRHGDDREHALRDRGTAAMDARFDAAWDALVASAADRGVPLVVLLIPSHVVAGGDAACRARMGEGFCDEELRRVAGVRERAAVAGLPVADGLAAWRESGADAFFPRADPGDVLHPSADGHERLAGALADTLATLLAPDPAPPDRLSSVDPPPTRRDDGDDD